MSISDRCETERISSLVEHHVPKAKLSQQHEAELTFTLPFESMDTFPGETQAVFVRGGAGGITLEGQSLSPGFIRLVCNVRPVLNESAKADA